MPLTDADVQQCQETITKAVAWLRRNQAELLALPDVSAHCKAPHLYAATGERV